MIEGLSRRETVEILAEELERQKELLEKELSPSKRCIIVSNIEATKQMLVALIPPAKQKGDGLKH